MKILITMLLALGLATAALAGGDTKIAPLEGEADYTREFDQTDTISPKTNVAVVHTMGDLSVLAWDKKEIRVQARIEVEGDQAKEFGEKVRIEIKNEKDAYKITTRLPEGDWKDISCAVALDVRLPAANPLKTTSSFGTVSIRGMRSSCIVEAATGDVDILDVQGEITLTNSLGATSVKECAGTVNITGHSSNITVTDLEGNLIIQNALGHVDVANVDGNIEASSTNGNIKAKGISYVNPRTKKGNIFNFNLSIGLIEITLPDPPSFNLTATVAFGSVESDFELSNVIRGPNSEVCLSRFGKGQANFMLSTTNGNIRLKKE
jgi:DUF4097 and DUF4098 domain-containing protein YvlB